MARINKNQNIREMEVLFRERGQYQLAMRRGKGEQVGSRLLPGFEVSVDYLFRGEG